MDGQIEVTTKPVVLVVEDDPLQMMIAGDLVEDAGLTPIFAENADEAIVMLESRDDIRIVVVSGHMLVEHAELPERSRFFNKPYAPDKMIGALRSLVA